MNNLKARSILLVLSCFLGCTDCRITEVEVTPELQALYDNPVMRFLTPGGEEHTYYYQGISVIRVEDTYGRGGSFCTDSTEFKTITFRGLGESLTSFGYGEMYDLFGITYPDNAGSAAWQIWQGGGTDTSITLFGHQFVNCQYYGNSDSIGVIDELIFDRDHGPVYFHSREFTLLRALN